MVQGKKITINISKVFVLYILAWTITPAMASGSIYRILLIICSVGWIFLNRHFVSANINMLSKMALLLIVFFGIQAISSSISIAISRSINLSIYCIVALIGLKYSDEEYDNHKNILIWMMFLSIVIALISANTVVNTPYALRVATHDWKNNTVSYGAYDFVYMCVQLVPFVFFSLFYYRRMIGKLWNILCFALLFVSSFLIIVSGFTLANIIAFTGVFLCVLLNKPSAVKTVIILLIVFLLALTYKQVLTYVFDILMKITADSPTYAGKVRDLYSQIVLQNGIGEAYSIRFSHYVESWETVFRYPIIGSVLITGKQLGGGHSTFVDVLAYGGVLLAIPYYWLNLLLPVKMVRKHKCCERYKKRELVLLFLIVTLFTGVFDTITYANAWVWYLFIPFLARTSELSRNQLEGIR